MQKITLILASCCLVLTAGLVAVVWLARSHPVTARQQLKEVNFQIGLGPQQPKGAGEQFNSSSVLLWDNEAQVIRQELNGFERRPIASITKLMTAMVLLDLGMEWEESVEILPEEYVIGGKLMLQSGETAKKRDLFYASLLGSANNATLALVRTSGITEQEFVQLMNRKAIELGLEQTQFVEVTGLDTDNLSTAYEVARMAEYAFEKYPDIAEASSSNEYTFTLEGSDREHTMRNTNKLISQENQVLSGSKTGYLDEAGYCLVVQGAGEFDRLIAVVLGSATEWGSLADTSDLLNKL